MILTSLSGFRQAGTALGEKQAPTADDFWEEAPQASRPLKNSRHDRFAEFFAAGSSGAEAYRKAFQLPPGHNVANRPGTLLKRPEVVFRIRALREKIVAKTVQLVVIDHAYLLDTLREVIERGMQRREVLDKQGEPTGEWRYEPTAVLKAIELAGRSNGLFSDKGKIDNLEEASEHELRAEVERLGRELEGALGTEGGDSSRAEAAQADSVPTVPEAG